MDKYLIGFWMLLLSACAGVNLPVIPVAPTVAESTEEQVIVNENVTRVCASLDQNETNLNGWLDLADLLGGAFGITVGDVVEIPGKLVAAKEAVCE